MEHNEESIDLSKLLRIMVEKKKTVICIVGFCTLIAIGTAFILPKQYESTTLVQTRSTGKDVSTSTAMMAAEAMGLGAGGGSAAGAPANYIELMKSRTVLDPIIDNMEWEDEKKKPDAEHFAKKNLDIKNMKQTNLITVTAKGRTPDEAQMISQSVVDNFLLMQTNMNQQTQSLLVKFLNGRIDTSKQESDDAAQKLADFSKAHKMYSPNDQVKIAIEQLNAYDKAIGDMQVQVKSAQAQYDTATSKLGEQKAGAKSYNINDNSTVQSIRSQIVAKQVELVGLEQRYTDQHPSIVTARQQLADLQNSLAQEVSAAVDSGAATLNPAYSELLKTQAIAQAQVSAASASEAAIRAKRDEKEKTMTQFPDDVMTYMQLDRDAKIKNEIYLNLVKQCEQDKIQEAMESMDVQIIDNASLPRVDKPSWPKVPIIILLGIIIGLFISIGYILWIYRKENVYN